MDKSDVGKGTRDALHDLVFLFAGVVLGCLFGFARGLGERPFVTVRDTLTYVDTVRYYLPVAKDSTVVRYETKKFLVIRDAGHSGNAGHSAREDTMLVGNHAQKDGEIIPQVLSDDRDSMTVEIPITQKVYEGDDYRAWVSGFQPSLDSIYVHPRTTVIRETMANKARRWHLGVIGGYGYGFSSKQLEPFFGVGVSYSLW